MPYLTYRPNLLDRAQDSVSFFPEGGTLTAVLTERFGSCDFAQPTYVEVNGIPWLRSRWSEKLPHSANVQVCVVPGAVTTAVLTAVAVASLLASAYVIYRIGQLPSIADSVGAKVPSKDPSFTFEGQKNVQRLNDVVDTTYGRLRWWPAYLCAPYVDYLNNKPTLHLWLCLGKGNYEIEDVRVNDTSLTSIAKALYTQHDSGYTIPLDAPYDLVYYAEEFRGTELNGTNEPEHGALGPYVLNPANTEVEDVVVNFRYPSGLYSVTPSTGAVGAATCTISVTLTEIDNAGNNTGGTQVFELTHSAAKTTALRLTEHLTPTDESFTGTGRYSITAIRTNAKNTGTLGQDQCEIETAFALGHSLRNYTSSLLYVQIPGTTTIGQNAAEKVNVVATRKLRKRVDGAWTSYAPCREAVWAIVDMLQQDFGGGVPDEKLDLAYWESIAEELSAYNFDYRFDQGTTLWNAITAVATVFRGKPYRVGADIRLSVDTPVAIPTCVFTPDSAKDLRVQMSFKTTNENDCVEAAYIDPVTGLQDSVFFTPPGSSAVKPTKVTFAGVTDRETAWKLAAYTYLQRTMLRDTLTMTTGLDGNIPVLGDVILVSWPFPSWSSAGVILASDGGYRLEISEATDKDAGWIALRKPNGSTWGPVRFTSTEVSDIGNPVVTLEYAPPAEFVFDGEDRDLVAYTLGDANTTTQRFQVTDVSPSGESVNIEAIAFDPSIFGYDNLSVPERGDDMLPYPSASGPMPWLRLLEESGQYLRVEVGPTTSTPVEVVCTFSYFPYLPVDPAIGVWTERLAQLQRPWDVFGTGVTSVVETAQAEGASFYIPRRTGYLIVKVEATMPDDQVFTAWWRGCPGVFGDTDAAVPFIYLVNNSNTTYAGPGSPSNVASPSAQGATLIGVDAVTYVTSGSAVLDTSEAKLVLTTDAPPAFGLRIEVVATVSSVEVGRAVKVVKDVGPITFTAEELKAAGVQGSETAYPALRALAYHTGADNEDQVSSSLQISPRSLTTDPVEQRVVYEDLGTMSYAEGSTWLATPGVFFRHADSYVQIYAVRTRNLLPGTFSLKVQTTYQVKYNNLDFDNNIKETRYVTSTDTVLVKRIRCAHLDPVAFAPSFPGALAGVMRFGVTTVEDYAYAGGFNCILLDANYEPVLLNIGALFVTHATLDMRSVPSDVVSDFFMKVGFYQPTPHARNLTEGEWEQIRAVAVYVVFVGTGASYPAPFNSPGFTDSWGKVRTAMIDMFGYKGNQTAWGGAADV